VVVVEVGRLLLDRGDDLLLGPPHLVVVALGVGLAPALAALAGGHGAGDDHDRAEGGEDHRLGPLEDVRHQAGDGDGRDGLDPGERPLVLLARRGGERDLALRVGPADAGRTVVGDRAVLVDVGVGVGGQRRAHPQQRRPDLDDRVGGDRDRGGDRLTVDERPVGRREVGQRAALRGDLQAGVLP
jgi:hypothetical protein